MLGLVAATIDGVVMWANLLGAVTAFSANAWAAVRDPRESRAARAAVAALAGAWAVLYAVTLSGHMSSQFRTDIAQGAAPVAWIVVWTMPAVVSMRVDHRIVVDLRRLIDRLPEPREDRARASR